MTNRYGVMLDPSSLLWAAAEGVSETVIAAVLLLHERSVEEIVAKLGAVTRTESSPLPRPAPGA